MKYNLIMMLLVMAALIQSSTKAMADVSMLLDRRELRAWLTPISRSDADPSAMPTINPLHPVARFYHKNGFQPAWSGPRGLLPPGEMVLDALTHSSQAGLLANDYHLACFELMGGQDGMRSDAMSPSLLKPYLKIDVMLTEGLLRYAEHLHRGQVRPETLYGKWLARRRPATRDIPEELAEVANDINRLKAYMESLHPDAKAYGDLRKTLQHYEQIRRSGGWPTIAAGPTLHPGDRDPRIVMLRRRLQITGDLPSDQASSDPATDTDVYDERVQAAVKRFQRRHGLQADGLVGKHTQAELNVPVPEKINKLQLNMERWRWLADDLGQRYLMVNIPAFELSIVEAHAPIKTVRAIVGKKGRQTPIMSGQMTYLELNPYWNIPHKIAREDILPKVLDDPDYLTRHGIRVFDSWDSTAYELDPTNIAWETLSSRHFPYRLRQDPSDVNALGRIKFMFPNPKSVYIHDTPGKSLFDRQQRSFSSGCVRVEAPLSLAQYLLRGQGWDRNRLEADLSKGTRRTVVLKQPIAVHLVYFTAWVDDEGQVNFGKDIYGHDRRLLAALAKRNADPVFCRHDAEEELLLTDRTETSNHKF